MKSNLFFAITTSAKVRHLLLKDADDLVGCRVQIVLDSDLWKVTSLDIQYAVDRMGANGYIVK